MGAILRVVFLFDCDLGHPECEPTIVFDKLSTEYIG